MIENLNAVCKTCGKGTYIETEFFDDMDGVLHCNNCGAEVKRHPDYKPLDITEEEILKAVLDSDNTPINFSPKKSMRVTIVNPEYLKSLEEKVELAKGAIKTVLENYNWLRDYPDNTALSNDLKRVLKKLEE